MKAYEVRGDTDTTEGRGPTYHIGFFMHESDANKAAEGKGAMGTPGYVKLVEVPDRAQIITKYDIRYLDRSSEKIEKEKALAKLSDREIELLGIKR